MKQARKRLTYANVMSSIAVFLVLGGATAFAAKKITSKELAGNSVTTAKIKKNAVTSSKIKNNSITTPKIAKDAVTGEKVNESTLGKVPSAANADNATNAQNAQSANTVGGIHMSKIDYAAGAGSTKQVVYSANGLTLYAECSSGNDLEFTATTSSDNAEIYESGNYTSTYEGDYDDDFDVGDIEEVGASIGDNTQEEVQGQLVYSTASGAVVTASFSLNDSEQGHGGTQACNVQGIANAS